MSIEYQAAVDEMFGMVNDTIETESPSLLGYIPDIRWPGVPKPNRPDQTKVWARVSTQLIRNELAALANANHQQLWEAVGMLFIQIFCPRNVASSRDPFGIALAQLLVDKFRAGSASGELHFYGPTMVELPETDENYPIRVQVKYDFQTISSIL